MNPKRFLIVGVLAVVTLFSAPAGSFCQVETLAQGVAEQSPATSQTISLTIDFGDGFQHHYTRVAWTDPMTVMDAMETLRLHPHPLLFVFRGKGETAFLKSLAGQENGGGSGRNWIYYVNGERADCSFGAKKLGVGDTVLWRFEEYP